MNDIVKLLYAMKENIRSVEEGNASETVLSALQSDCMQLLELLKLFLISEQDSYYGYFLMNLSFHIDFGGKCIACIRLNTFPPLLVTNPLLLGKFTLKEILYIFCHEIDHIVLNHPVEMVRLNPTGDEDTFRRFNVAADASVNDRINHEINETANSFMAAPEGIITSSTLKKSYRLRRVLPLESYLYYYNLIKDIDREAPPAQQDIMLSKVIEQGDESEEAAVASGDIVTAYNAGQIEDHEWAAGSDAEDAAASVRELVNAAVSMMNDEVRGQMPGFFLSQVALLNQPPVLPWQAILKKYVGTITAEKRKTRTRLNRRQPERFDLSGTVDEKVLKIVIAIDTSASMSDDLIAALFSEIFAIIAKRKHAVTVIECDSQVQRVYQMKDQRDANLRVQGRGGTAFTPVIEHLNANRYFRDALLIYFTDGYGEASIPRPRTYRNLWVVLDDAKNLSLKNPYGAVVSFIP